MFGKVSLMNVTLEVYILLTLRMQENKSAYAQFRTRMVCQSLPRGIWATLIAPAYGLLRLLVKRFALSINENSGQDLAYYAKLIRSKPYEFGAHFMPHDAAHERLGMGGSISSQMKELGVPNKIITVGSVAARIEQARSLLKECYIDESKCKDGIHALTNYQYEWDDKRGKFKSNPLHDWASDGADAFGYLAQAVKIFSPKTDTNRPDPRKKSASSWMRLQY